MIKYHKKLWNSRKHVHPSLFNNPRDYSVGNKSKRRFNPNEPNRRHTPETHERIQCSDCGIPSPLSVFRQVVSSNPAVVAVCGTCCRTCRKCGKDVPHSEARWVSEKKRISVPVCTDCHVKLQRREAA